MGIFRRQPRAPRLTAKELADQLEVLASAVGWTERDIHDELDNVPIEDPRLEGIRRELMNVSHEFAAAGGRTYFAEKDLPLVRARVSELRRMSEGGVRSHAPMNMVGARLSLQRALLGTVTLEMRGISVNVQPTLVRITVYVDGDPDEGLREDLEAEVVTQLLADLGDAHSVQAVELQVLRVDVPSQIKPDGEWVFLRKEVPGPASATDGA